MLWPRPLNKRSPLSQPKVPQYMMVEHDSKGSDAYEALVRMVRVDPVRDCEKEHVPLLRRFAGDGSWSHMTVSMMR